MSRVVTAAAPAASPPVAVPASGTAADPDACLAHDTGGWAVVQAGW